MGSNPGYILKSFLLYVIDYTFNNDWLIVISSMIIVDHQYFENKCSAIENLSLTHVFFSSFCKVGHFLAD